jgi:SAM-dependent methyltransferase
MVRAKPEPAIHPFDRLHGTDTSGLIPGRIIARGTAAKVEELTAYYGVAPSILHGLLDLWLQTTAPAPIQAIDRPAARPRDIEHTVFLDIGAGKGRALLLASQYPFLRVEGVELNPSLVRIAQSNIDLWQRNPLAQPLAPLLLHHADATTHPLPPEPTVAFLFHPFELPILRRFLRHVETTLAARARAKNAQPFHLLYANAEHGSLLDRHPAFTRLWIGNVAMSPADHVADLAAIAEQKEYGSTGDELCAIYRFTGRHASPRRRTTQRANRP